MSCKKINIGKGKVCIGDMKHQIFVIAKAIETLPIGYTIDFSNQTEIFAAIQTIKGTPIWDGTNVKQELTHIFYIWYGIAEVQKNYTILFNNKYYKVEDAEDLNEEHIYLKITTVERGLTANKANWA
jgi:hypothetical protein